MPIVMQSLDQALFRWINGWPELLRPLFWFFSQATKDHSTRIWVIGFFLVLVVALIIKKGKHRQAAVLSLIAWPLANEFSESFKLAIPMLRPCNELADVHLRVGALTTYGTASSHAANMAAVAFVFVYFLRVWGSPWVLVAFLTGLSRIYVGVHYPSQVLLGWICGCLCALVAIKTYEAYCAIAKR